MPVEAKPEPKPTNGTEKPKPEPKPWTVYDRAAFELEKMALVEKKHVEEIRRSIATGRKNHLDTADLEDQAKVFALLEQGYRKGAEAVRAMEKKG